LLASRVGGVVEQDTGLARTMLDLAVGDPAEVPARLAGLDLEPARRDTLLLEAFIRLVNASRYDEAVAYIETHDVPALVARVGGDVAKNTGLARMVLDLAVGDPADVPGRLQGMELEPERRDTLLLEAFIRLVNASRYDEALAYIETHEVALLASRVGGVVEQDTGLARTMLDLAVGDPAEVPARLAGLDLEPARRDTLLLEAFIRLANASRYAEALDYIAAHDVPALAARAEPQTAAGTAIGRAVVALALGDPAGVPALLYAAPVDAERTTNLILAAFTGLVNSGRLADAEAMAEAEPCLRDLDAQQGEAADNARIASILLDLQSGRAVRAARRAEALEQAGGDPAQASPLYVEAFIRLVNAGDFAGAREIGEGVTPRLALCPPTARLDALAALTFTDAAPGGEGARVPERLATLEAAGADEARVRDLAFSVFSIFVNAADFEGARGLSKRVEPLLVSMRPPYGAVQRDALFAAGMLYLQQQDDWRRGTATLARLRDDLVKAVPPGGEAHPLFWSALRGEVVTLLHLKRAEEATALLQAFTAAYTGAPEDLLQHVIQQTT